MEFATTVGDCMRRLLLLILTILSLSAPSYAEYIVKLNNDITKFDNTKIESILNNWFIVDNIDNLDVAYAQENYTYMACELEKPLLLTPVNMSKMPINNPKEGSNVAILDTGIDLHNESLKNYILKQYNVYEDNTEVQDECGHGTHLAGIITSISNNKVIPIKVLNGMGTGKSSDIAIGIKWAVDEGAKIINLSLGGTKYDQLLKETIDYAVEHNCIVVCASGNTYGEKKIYPACLDNTISVGSIDKDGNISNFSNRGDSVDIYARGDVTSFDLNGEYKERCGTSMSCAIVSAELSLIFSTKK